MSPAYNCTMTAAHKYWDKNRRGSSVIISPRETTVRFTFISHFYFVRIDMKNNNVYFRFFCCLTNVSANPADFTVTTNNLDTFCPRIVLVLSYCSLHWPSQNQSRNYDPEVRFRKLHRNSVYSVKSRVQLVRYSIVIGLRNDSSDGYQVEILLKR